MHSLKTQKSTSALHPAAQICSQNQMTDQACTMAVAVARIHGFHSFPVKFIFIIPEIWASSRARYLWQQAPKGKGFRCVPRKAPLAGELARRSRGGEVVSNLQLLVASGGPIFSLAGEKIGEKRVLGRVWCFLPLILGKSQCFERRSTR